jgi:hypothetical protein
MAGNANSNEIMAGAFRKVTLISGKTVLDGFDIRVDARQAITYPRY